MLIGENAFHMNLYKNRFRSLSSDL